MTDDNIAYIRFEREEKIFEIHGKGFNEEPRQTTKAQYNAIVKLLREANWANSTEDEISVIS
jgi:hypothetical protein